MNKLQQRIKKRGNIFEVSDRHLRRHLELDFTRILNDLSFREFVRENAPLTNDMVLAHYQARPRKQSPDDDFYRVFGLYDTKTDFYVARGDLDIKATEKFCVQMFSLDESIARTVPTAVMVYFDACIRVEGEKVYIEPSGFELSPDLNVGKAVLWHGEEPTARKIIQPEN